MDIIERSCEAKCAGQMMIRLTLLFTSLAMLKVMFIVYQGVLEDTVLQKI